MNNYEYSKLVVELNYEDSTSIPTLLQTAYVNLSEEDSLYTHEPTEHIEEIVTRCPTGNYNTNVPTVIYYNVRTPNNNVTIIIITTVISTIIIIVVCLFFVYHKLHHLKIKNNNNNNKSRKNSYTEDFGADINAIIDF